MNIVRHPQAQIHQQRQEAHQAGNNIPNRIGDALKVHLLQDWLQSLTDADENIVLEHLHLRIEAQIHVLSRISQHLERARAGVPQRGKHVIQLDATFRNLVLQLLIGPLSHAEVLNEHVQHRHTLTRDRGDLVLGDLAVGLHLAQRPGSSLKCLRAVITSARGSGGHVLQHLDRLIALIAHVGQGVRGIQERGVIHRHLAGHVTQVRHHLLSNLSL